MKQTKSPYASIRMFKSPYLEFFTHVPPWLPLAIWGPVSLYFLWRASHVLNPLLELAITLVGLLTWTLAEYLLHRFVFHFHAATPFEKRIQFIIHGVHHDDPHDPTRLVMPPILSFFLAIIFYSAFHLIFAAGADAFFPGFVIGYLMYDYTHYAIHHFVPRTAVGKALRRNHMIHHFKEHDARWGVSTTFWDYVFHTREEPAKLGAWAAKSSR